MSIYAKLNAARTAFHAIQLKKSGRNTFANYDYFELGDFLIPAMKVLADHELCAVVSFEKDTATMRVVDVTNPADSIVLTSPMGSAALKGCHEVQNIGAVETYQRRYLWVALMEIVEHDALDATTGKDKPAKRDIRDPKLVRPATQGIGDDLPEERKFVVDAVVSAIVDHYNSDDTIGAYEEYCGITDADEKVLLWRQLPANIKSAIRAHADQLKKEAGFARA